ncbi:TetR/AcrR family transcriptional regulator C-terminal domain-containing protein [Kitasatospora sp. NPDC001175]|uniref:TetR/AcrR family transcriptional regulator C-terminal domain-containing protein n=1 Tax=Kitasatospora sp. NPDC001175 TaxID=3157103 RepID=UPI003CFF30E0
MSSWKRIEGPCRSRARSAAAAASRRAAQVRAEAGFPPNRAWEHTFAVFYFILGHTIEEQAQSRMPTGDNWTARLAAAGLDTNDPLATGLKTLAATDPSERFSYGLRVFLAGVQQHAPEAAVARTRQRPPAIPDLLLNRAKVL